MAADSLKPSPASVAANDTHAVRRHPPPPATPNRSAASRASVAARSGRNPAHSTASPPSGCAANTAAPSPAAAVRQPTGPERPALARARRARSNKSHAEAQCRARLMAWERAGTAPSSLKSSRKNVATARGLYDRKRVSAQ